MYWSILWGTYPLGYGRPSWLYKPTKSGPNRFWNNFVRIWAAREPNARCLIHWSTRFKKMQPIVFARGWLVSVDLSRFLHTHTSNISIIGQEQVQMCLRIWTGHPAFQFNACAWGTNDIYAFEIQAKRISGGRSIITLQNNYFHIAKYEMAANFLWKKFIYFSHSIIKKTNGKLSR